MISRFARRELRNRKITIILMRHVNRIRYIWLPIASRERMSWKSLGAVNGSLPKIKEHVPLTAKPVRGITCGKRMRMPFEQSLSRHFWLLMYRTVALLIFRSAAHQVHRRRRTMPNRHGNVLAKALWDSTRLSRRMSISAAIRAAITAAFAPLRARPSRLR